MLTVETKRHIDAARQVLVGVVPNPSSQIDQITNALIYKFMDDMDQSAIEVGGKPSFFVGELERYAWTRLMDARLGNQERMNLYSAALVKFSEMKQLPQFFRDVFKSAFLPYRSPEVLGLFLKEIDYFDYSHSEELGNAYEYLLSIMSSQGDAGQFRTPRHIIDFIVAVVNPTKDDKVLDPACGTAGFLVSAYKHILAQHDEYPDKSINQKRLTPDQRRKLMQNFEGYDVDPGMVRIAQVNMYLHQFKNPNIYNYNTLSDDDRWGDKFDVILANPPFMSPKGGVSTHSKFSVPSNRSEVLFVDYIMTHLRPKGRAGIIVPEGIIFQSGIAHKKLRELLVKDGLYAVASLPSGVFNPYSGVKTSILFFDNEMGNKHADLLFVKIENDGYDLGATKRQINKNDLPQALEILISWKQGKKIESPLAVYVAREKIAEGGDYNLTSDRHRVATDYTNAKWPMVKLGEIARVTAGQSPEGKYYNDKGEGVPFYQGKTEFQEKYLGSPTTWTTQVTKEADKGDILMSVRAPVGPVNFSVEKICIGRGLAAIRPSQKVHPEFLFSILKEKESEIVGSQGATFASINKNEIENIYIPLPSLEIQKHIVAELGSYQGVISGARKIIANWKPAITIDPGWEKVKIGDIATLTTGGTPLSTKKEYYGGDIKWLVSGDIHKGEIFDCEGRITKLALEESNAKLLPIDSVLMALNGQGKTRGTVAILRIEATCNQSLVSINPNKKQMSSEFLYYVLRSRYQEIRDITGDDQRSGLNMPIIRSIEVPIPSIEIQNKIVKEIESERALVESSKKLIEIFEQKTKDTLSKFWAE